MGCSSSREVVISICPPNAFKVTLFVKLVPCKSIRLSAVLERQSISIPTQSHMRNVGNNLMHKTCLRKINNCMTTNKKNKKRITTRLTIVYKFILPIILIGILIALNLAIKEVANRTDILVINGLCLFLLTIGYLPMSNIKEIHIDSKKIYCSNYFSEKEYELKTIIKVKRWFFFHYRIFLEKDGNIKKIKFLPLEFLSLTYLFKKPDSVIILERKINSIK